MIYFFPFILMNKESKASANRLRFRAWAHSSKTMFYPDTDEGWELLNGELHALPNTTLMQSTGLTDRNGKEIYEHDIAEWKFCGEACRHEVLFDEGMFCISMREGHYPLCEYLHQDLKIIGNIYESPELLP